MHVEIERTAGLAPGEVEVRIDGQPLAGCVLTVALTEEELTVRVRCG